MWWKPEVTLYVSGSTPQVKNPQNINLGIYRGRYNFQIAFASSCNKCLGERRGRILGSYPLEYKWISSGVDKTSISELFISSSLKCKHIPSGRYILCCLLGIFHVLSSNWVFVKYVQNALTMCKHKNITFRWVVLWSSLCLLQFPMLFLERVETWLVETA